jgi:hypothetical protein
LVSERIRVVMRIQSFTLPRYRAYTDLDPGSVITLKAKHFLLWRTVSYNDKKNLFVYGRYELFLKHIYLRYDTIIFEKLPKDQYGISFANFIRQLLDLDPNPPEQNQCGSGPKILPTLLRNKIKFWLLNVK